MNRSLSCSLVIVSALLIPSAISHAGLFLEDTQKILQVSVEKRVQLCNVSMNTKADIAVLQNVSAHSIVSVSSFTHAKALVNIQSRHLVHLKLRLDAALKVAAGLDLAAILIKSRIHADAALIAHLRTTHALKAGDIAVLLLIAARLEGGITRANLDFLLDLKARTGLDWISLCNLLGIDVHLILKHLGKLLATCEPAKEGSGGGSQEGNGGSANGGAGRCKTGGEVDQPGNGAGQTPSKNRKCRLEGIGKLREIKRDIKTCLDAKELVRETRHLTRELVGDVRHLKKDVIHETRFVVRDISHDVRKISRDTTQDVRQSVREVRKATQDVTDIVKDVKHKLL